MIDATETKIVSGIPPRKNGRCSAMKSGWTRPVEAMATAIPPTRTIQVIAKARAKRTPVRRRARRISSTMAPGGGIASGSRPGCWAAKSVMACPRADDRGRPMGRPRPRWSGWRGLLRGGREVGLEPLLGEGLQRPVGVHGIDRRLEPGDEVGVVGAA